MFQRVHDRFKGYYESLKALKGVTRHFRGTSESLKNVSRAFWEVSGALDNISGAFQGVSRWVLEYCWSLL